MKKLIILTIIICTSLAVQAQDEVFEKLADTKGITVVHISKSMLNMMPNIKTEGMNIGEVAGKLSAITILTGENEKSSQMMRKEINSLIKRDGYEQTMFIKDDMSKTAFYFKAHRKDPSKNEMIMLSDEGFEVSVIRIAGSISAEDIQKITSRSNNKNKEREKVLRDAEKTREEALKEGQRARENAQKIRERALKDSERAREEALKEQDRILKESQKERERALREANREREKALKEAQRAIEEAQRLMEQKMKEIDKSLEKK